MNTVFKELTDNSKVLIFPGNRILNSDEKEFLRKSINKFLSQWKSHGKQMRAYCEVLYSIFIVIGIDENYGEGSGCSKDALGHKIKQLGQELNVDFFKNGNLIFFQGEEIEVVPFEGIKEAVKNNKIQNNTPVFNYVETNKDFKERWLIPAESSWLKSYLNIKDLV